MPRQKQLVSQYLENIAGDALERYEEIIRDYIRDRQGIYALFKRGKLYYVGLAHNLRNRLRTHLRDHHADCWDRFSVYLTIGDTHLKELESLVLRIIKPKGNRQKGKFYKAESLRSRFSNDIRRQLQAEWKSVLGKSATREFIALAEKDGGEAVLATYIKGPIKLKAKFKGENIAARVRKDGTISLRGRRYSSPSLAAEAVCKRASNGWMFWRYERAPGDWVKLDNLRK